MHNRKQDKAKNTRLIWLSFTLFLSTMVVAFMLMSITFIKEKATISYPANNTYRAGDIAVFVAMPLLNAAIK